MTLNLKPLIVDDPVLGYDTAMIGRCAGQVRLAILRS
jgi:hypothetical protein